MQRKNIKYNSTPKKLCILSFEESRDIFGAFSNQEIDEYYKTAVNRSELRGINFEPTIKNLEITHETLDILKYQMDKFESLFNWFFDVYSKIDILSRPKQFSSPYYVEDLPLDNNYLFVLNDFPSTPDNPNFNIDNYINFTNIYTYPERILKVNDSILRSQLNLMIDIEGLKANGFIRDYEDKDVFNKLLQAQLDGRLDNKYFQLAAESYKHYLTVKRLVDAQDYADEKLAPYESEYLILKNLRFDGELFARHNFTIDRVIFSKSGIFVLSLFNYGNENQTIHITPDNKWVLSDNTSQETLIELPSPVEELALNCIAIKKLVRINYGEEVDKIPVKPIIVIANDDVRIQNESHNQVIRGSDIYNMVESENKVMELEHIMDIGTTIFNYKIAPLKNTYHLYTSDLESAESVYEDLYYNHIQTYLPKFIQLIWEVKKKDYYESHIREKNILMGVGIIASLGILARIVIGFIFSPSFASNYLSLYLWDILWVLFISFTINEWKYKKSWLAGAESGDCYEVERKLGIFGGIGSLFMISFIVLFFQIMIKLFLM